MPEDEQATGNLAIGASSAQAFVLVMDACQGIPPRTRRDVCIASLFGIGNLIVSLNKMDLVGFDSAISEQLKRDFLQFAGPLLFPQIQFIPVSALAGDNVVARSNRMAWYEGPPLLEALESIQTCDDLGARRFRFSVQTAIRTNRDLRGYAGRIVSGGIRPGEEMLVLPSKACVTVDRIDNDQPALGEIFVSKPVVISLKEHSDPGRSEILCDPRHPLAQTKKFRARLIWISA